MWLMLFVCFWQWVNVINRKPINVLQGILYEKYDSVNRFWVKSNTVVNLSIYKKSIQKQCDKWEDSWRHPLIHTQIYVHII